MHGLPCVQEGVCSMDIFSKKDLIQAIYQEGGFLRAARALHIAQPSLSVMVAGIEKEIGGQEISGMRGQYLHDRR